MEKGEESIGTGEGEELVKRKKREHIDHLAYGLPKWSTNKTVLKSEPSKEELKEGIYVKRKGEGYKLKNDRVPESVGLYEFSITGKDSKGENFKIPVYLGKAGELEGEIKATLKSRFDTYARTGSHKKDIFNAILWGGFNIDHRYVVVTTRGDEKDTLIRNKEWESKILDNVDYALNIQENGKARYRDIYLPYKEGYINLDKLYKSYLVNLENPGKSTKDLGKIMEKEIPDKVSKEEYVTSTTPKKKTYFTKKTTSKRIEEIEKKKTEDPSKVHLKADGTLDKRYKENKGKIPVIKPTKEVHLKVDGTLDKRYKENKVSKEKVVVEPPKEVHLKADGTLDKRYKENKTTESYVSTTPSSVTIHLKSDGSPDYRYKENKVSTPSYESDYSSSSSSYGSVGSSYTSSYSDSTWEKTGSYGGWDDLPLTLSGDPDMRYSVCKDLFG